MAEWSCSGLQSRVRRFDSDPRLHQSRLFVALDVNAARANLGFDNRFKAVVSREYLLQELKTRSNTR